jgi:hypothetical protein
MSMRFSTSIKHLIANKPRYATLALGATPGHAVSETQVVLSTQEEQPVMQCAKWTQYNHVNHYRKNNNKHTSLHATATLSSHCHCPPNVTSCAYCSCHSQQQEIRSSTDVAASMLMRIILSQDRNLLNFQCRFDSYRAHIFFKNSLFQKKFARKFFKKRFLYSPF